MEESYEKFLAFFEEVKLFFSELTNYLIKNFHLSFSFLNKPRNNIY